MALRDCLSQETDPLHKGAQVEQIIPASAPIINDYGRRQGGRKACDEYLSQNRLPILLNRIDYKGRIAIKP